MSYGRMNCPAPLTIAVAACYSWSLLNPSAAAYHYVRLLLLFGAFCVVTAWHCLWHIFQHVILNLCLFVQFWTASKFACLVLIVGTVLVV